MTSDKIPERDLDAVADDEPTAELEALTDAKIAATGKAPHDDFDESRSTSRAELEARVTICELQSEIERLRSGTTKLDTETRAFKKLRDEIADELEQATRKNAELTALLGQRDEELAALKSALAAKGETGGNGAGPVEEAAVEAPSPVPPQREFDPSEMRKLVGQGEYAAHEFELRPGPMSLGSAGDNDMQIKAEFVSRHHAQIVSGSRETILKDMNSTNGTFVNSRKISKCALHDGDSVTIGKLSFTFVMQKKVTPDIYPVTSMPAPEDSAPLDRGSWR